MDFSRSLDLAGSLWPSDDISVTEPTYCLERYNFAPTTPQNQNSVQQSLSLDPAGSAWRSNDISVVEPTFGLENYRFTPTTPQDQNSLQYLLSPVSPEGMLGSVANSPITNEASNLSSGMDPRKGIEITHDEEPRCSSNEGQGSISHQGRRYPKEATSYDVLSSSSQIPTVHGAAEESLFMYYLDQVFYVQYPVFQSRGT